jgi:hypothetical protein
MGFASATYASERLRVVHHHATPVDGWIEFGVCTRVTTTRDDPLDKP